MGSTVYMNFHLKDGLGVNYIAYKANWCNRDRWHHLHLFSPYHSFAAHAQ